MYLLILYMMRNKLQANKQSKTLRYHIFQLDLSLETACLVTQTRSWNDIFRATGLAIHDAGAPPIFPMFCGNHGNIFPILYRWNWKLCLDKLRRNLALYCTFRRRLHRNGRTESNTTNL